MSKESVIDELWEIIEPLLPPEPPKPRGGRPRVSHRAALTRIIFVLKSGIPWEILPKEMGAGPEISAGDACATGQRPACGKIRTGRSWIVSGRPTRSSGSGLFWTQ